MTDEYSQIELLAKVLEYEHALQHAVDPHPVPGAPPHEACPDCQRLCQSALDGLNREGFREMATDYLEAYAYKVCPVCNNTGVTYDFMEDRNVPCGGINCRVQR